MRQTQDHAPETDAPGRRACELFSDPAETRTLCRLHVSEGETGCSASGQLRVGAAIDVETTGLSPGKAVIIELAIRRFMFDEAGAIIRVGKLYSWREDPGCTLEPEIARLTGLSDADLVGQGIDEGAASRLLRSTALIIAHNAEFDRKFVERRLPQATGLAWACSCKEIDWSDWGYEGRSLGYLCTQMGLFFDAHRAGTDVDALIALVSEPLSDGRTALAHLTDSAFASSFRVEATGAAYAVKDDLKDRGYRWDDQKRVWWTEVPERRLQEEQFWLASHIYEHPGTRSFGPTMIERSANERYS